MKLAIIVAGLPPEVLGGAETQAARTAALLAAHHHVTVLSRSRARPRDWNGLHEIELVTRPCGRRRGLRFALDLLATLVALTRRRRALDVILAYQAVIDGLIAVIAGRLWGIPTLVWVRSEAEFRRAASAQTRWLSPWVFRHASRVAVQTPALRVALLAELAAADPALAASVAGRLVVIGNGVALPAAPLPPAGDDLLFIGRLTPDKGLEPLIAALRRCPAARLTIVGEGAERARLEALAQDLPNVHFAGRCAPEDVPARIAACAVLVLPSLRNEGLPNVVLEAMAAGRAVLATRHAGLPDLVEDGVSGLLVPPGDSAALAVAIERLRRDPALRTRLGAAARERVAAYAWPAIVATLEAELAGLVARA